MPSAQAQDSNAATSALSTSTVKAIAKLARLYENMDETLAQEYTKELSGILDLANQLQQIDTSSIDVFDGVRTITIDQLRDDVASEGEDYERIRANIIGNFPNVQNNLLVIQGIFDRD